MVIIKVELIVDCSDVHQKACGDKNICWFDIVNFINNFKCFFGFE